MPGAVARTSTQALNNATLPFVLKLAQERVEEALANSQHLAHGLNVAASAIKHAAVAATLDLPLAA
jgi:alanine dehydrogenase